MGSNVVRVDPRAVRKRTYQVLRMTCKTHFRLRHPPDAGVFVRLHWTLFGSVPCRGKACIACHLESREYGYAMVQLYRRHQTLTEQSHAAVMPIPAESIADYMRLEEHRLYVGERQGGKTAARIVYQFEDFLTHHEFPPVDLMDQLDPLWRSRESKLIEHWSSHGVHSWHAEDQNLSPEKEAARLYTLALIKRARNQE